MKKSWNLQEKHHVCLKMMTWFQETFLQKKSVQKNSRLIKTHTKNEVFHGKMKGFVFLHMSMKNPGI